MSKLFVVVLSILLANNPTVGNAQAGEVPLEVNMSTSEVVQYWGEAAEKIEYEIKREERWLYPEGEVLFRDGRVVNWNAAPGTRLRRSQDAIAAEKANEVEQPSKKNIPLEDILGDIMREVDEGK